MIRFSGGVLGAALLNYVNRNADNFLIGRFLDAAALGYYSIAYRLMLLPLTYVSSSIGAVTYPALVQLQDDLDRYKRVYLRTCSVIAFVSFPMMSGLFVVADQFVAVVLGSKWLAATTVLKILCPLGMMQSIATTVGLIYTSTGRTKTLFLWNLGATPFYRSLVCGGIAVGNRGHSHVLRCGILRSRAIYRSGLPSGSSVWRCARCCPYCGGRWSVHWPWQGRCICWTKWSWQV